MLYQIYLRYSWGAEEKTELANEAARFAHKFQQQGDSCDVQEVIEQGKQAFRLITELKNLLSTKGQDVAQQWLKENASQYSHKVKRSLEIELEKSLKRVQQLAERKKHKAYTSSITPVHFSDHHPQSIQHLDEDSEWSVYIDESGQYFETATEEYSVTNFDLGRVVALVVPGRTKLEPLPANFHATESSPAEVDRCMQYLLEQDVGVFGFTVNDPGAFAGNWFSHVVLLARWVLLQLPLAAHLQSKVSFYIERNDARMANEPINSLANQLEGELKAIDSERFANVQISTQLMDKSHPYNGYVDTLAYTWGSPAAHSKDRLQKSSLLEHCLLQPNQQSMLRLYLSVSRDEKLLAGDWYLLCSAAAGEADNGFLTGQLHRLGQKTVMDLRLWQYYLEEVRERFRSKNYSLSQVNHALNWLERYIPENYELPAIYRLPLETARLGQENHQGKVNLQRLERVLALIAQLEEEDAQQACGALLRVAVSGSNSFEFTLLQPIIREWLDKPIAVSGLANYARLHSTLGQMYAFNNEADQALYNFDQAFHYLDRLSDKQRSKREKQQTNTYRQIVLLDSVDTASNQWRDLLNEIAGSNNWLTYSSNLAISGQELRYSHHLWLRALLSMPEQTAPAREAYLLQEHMWQSGSDHPWGLIAAYRAWLLKQINEEVKASLQMNLAIDLCTGDGSGPVLWWMAEVLRVLAVVLDIACDERPSIAERERLAEVLPAAPHNHLQNFLDVGGCDNRQAISWLKLCLPFNFH